MENEEHFIAPLALLRATGGALSCLSLLPSLVARQSQPTTAKPSMPNDPRSFRPFLPACRKFQNYNYRGGGCVPSAFAKYYIVHPVTPVSPAYNTTTPSASIHSPPLPSPIPRVEYRGSLRVLRVFRFRYLRTSPGGGARVVAVRGARELDRKRLVNSPVETSNSPPTSGHKLGLSPPAFFGGGDGKPLKFTFPYSRSRLLPFLS